MRIGIDFDNTIICYDGLFESIALAKGWWNEECVQKNLRDELILKGKNAVKEEILKSYGNAIWTDLQSLVYGEAIFKASPYPGVREFLEEQQNHANALYLISHKTRYAVARPEIDLQRKAQEWLEKNKFDSYFEKIIFCETRALKIQAIQESACQFFIDDLPEVFNENDFPTTVTPLLFDPENNHPMAQWQKFQSWKEIQKFWTRSFKS